jgi:N,N-dimethylformamidase
VDEKQIIAYADPWSVAAGDTLDVMVSCAMAGQFKAELVELICGDSRPHGTGFKELAIPAEFEGLHAGREQKLRPGSYAVLPDIPSLAKVSICLYVYPTLLARDWQPVVSGDGLLLDIRDGSLGVSLDGGERLTLAQPMQTRRWHQVLVTYDSGSGRLSLAMRRFGLGAGERNTDWLSQAISVAGRQLAACDWLLAASLEKGELVSGFNGRLEAPRMVANELTNEVAESLLSSTAVTHVALLGAWDFAQGIESEQIIDLSPAKRHGWTMQLPTRAVKGVHWNGTVQQWTDDPAQYAAIHFHEDDLVDAGWTPDFSWLVPADVPSGVYAVKLTLGGTKDYVPFFVRPSERQEKADVVYLASTATYLAYANQRLGFTGGIFGDAKPKNPEDAYLLHHPEVGYSLYEYHADGSGVHFSSRLRPILNMRPKTVTWSFNADTNITNWLKALEQPFDVVTDEDLHREGAELLSDYRVVITGTHPEYYSTPMLDALDGWLNRGGRLMYMGGNGFYWRIAYHPENPGIIEVRRAEDGTRAWIAEPGEYYHSFTGEYGGLWRRLGRPPNELVGIGFAAQGFDGGTYYRLGPGALDERVSFIMNGVSASDVIGDYGTQGGGAAGEEIDRLDESLGSPAHAICIASSENHRPGMLRVKEEIHMSQPELQGPKVRADMVFFETPAGGAVFSTGSISYAGALSHNAFDNDIARMTSNVLRRFLDEAPFDYPD